MHQQPSIDAMHAMYTMCHAHHVGYVYHVLYVYAMYAMCHVHHVGSSRGTTSSVSFQLCQASHLSPPIPISPIGTLLLQLNY
eukprot:7887358-Pyramimonas_sp.AAC.2